MSGKRTSLLVLQVKQIIEERGIKIRTLAAAVGVTESTISSWLGGASEPSISQYERLVSLLRLVPIITDVSSGSGSISIRDFLPDDEAQLFDQLSENNSDILKNQLRDLQLQRIRIEDMYSDGGMEYDEYFLLVTRIADSIRFTIDACSKIDLGAKMGSESDVEVMYGSAKGPGYDHEAVEKVKAQKKAKEEENATKDKPCSASPTA